MEEGEESGDEPLLSGSGGVSKECSETELAGWGEVIYCSSLRLCFLLCCRCSKVGVTVRIGLASSPR